MITKPSQCPIADDQAEIVSLSSDLIRAYRRYKRDLDVCAACPDQEFCSIRRDVEAVINQAATEVRDEWDRIHNQEGPR